MKQTLLFELRLRVEAILRTNQYKESSIRNYQYTWNHIQKFMNSNVISFYSRAVGKSFLNDFHQNKFYKELTDNQKGRIRHVDVLSDVLETGNISRGRYAYYQYIFSGELGKPFNDFLNIESQRKKASSIALYKGRVNNLYQFLLTEEKTLNEIDFLLIIKFLGKLEKENSISDRNNIIMSIRVFFRYLCEYQLLSDNCIVKWRSLLKIRHLSTPEIPSVYSKEEVEAMIAAIDRANPQGKRDYAMILLAARYGIRASDIIGFRFNNLDWVQNRIIIIQQKTGKKVTLPLSEEVGDAIIEYIKYGRPDIDLPYVFITANAPYKELGSNSLGNNIADYMRVAGINMAGRKHGPHALRHSLATNLLKSNEPLPIISEILGHCNTQSTMAYLRVDLDLLRQCALDVPFVPSSFYNNLYE